MNRTEIHRGNQIGPGENVLWRGSPKISAFARDVYHLRFIAGYFVVLWAADLFQIWHAKLPVGPALYNSVPLVAITGAVVGLAAVLAGFSARTTHYVVTDRRVILHYGIAMSATLSLPHSQIAAVSAATGRHGYGDVALELRDGNRMPYLKLWPLARAWHITKPQPMLRCVADAEAVGAIVARAMRIAHEQRAVSVTETVPHVEVVPTRQAA